MQISLKKIGKSLLLIGLLSLIIQSWDFSTYFIPKPFELIITVLVALTAYDVIKNKRIKQFWQMFPKKIWIALIILISSIFFGWFIATFFYGISYTFNALLEFGTFAFSVALFLLIVWYTENDTLTNETYFNALLLPVCYIIFTIFPGAARYLHLTSDSKFLGLTVNPNYISKALLIPLIFFVTKTFFEKKQKSLKLLYFIISSLLMALTFWTGSRGAILSLIAGIGVVGILYVNHESFSWGKLFSAAGITLLMVIVGFVFTPYSGKQVIVDRLLNPDNKQLTYSALKSESVITIIQGSSHVNSLVIQQPLTPDTRLEIWPFYLKLVLMHPFGFGPNTHMQTDLPSQYGGYLNTGPHNTYLEIWLWGGLLGLISFLYILFAVLKDLGKALQRKVTIRNVVLMGILVAFLIGFMFDDSLSLYIFWAVLALAYRVTEGDTTTPRVVSKYFQPKKYLDYCIRKMKGLFSGLENDGERVDIIFTSDILLSDNEKCHLNRYYFAQKIIGDSNRIADFACGTGYGSALLAKTATSVLGIDIDKGVIQKIQKKYAHISNLHFEGKNLLEINFNNEFDAIVSFETVEHFLENDIVTLFGLYNAALVSAGKLIFSTPYLQKNDKNALDMGFHKTFFIDEEKITRWMDVSNFTVKEFYYQSYDNPELLQSLDNKDFIICVAEKNIT